MTKQRRHGEDLRAVAKLAVHATKQVTEVVEEMHVTIASGPAILGRPLQRPVRAIAGLVYGHVRRVTGLVGRGVDGALSLLEPLLGESEPGPERDALEAATNGVIGDYLHEIGSPLAIQMAFRSGGQSLPLEARALRVRLPGAGPKLLVLLHGSSMNDRQWTRCGHDHGAALANDLGYAPVYLHYNSGLHISENGHAFAKLLEQLVAAWPVEIDEIALLGHSMGGLVARSACHAAEQEGLGWRKKLTKLACLGSPHHGSPLERSGNLLHSLLDVTSYSAPLSRLGRLRSAGVTDLRFGNVRGEHWEGVGRFEHRRDTRCALPLPEGVAAYAIAGTTATKALKKLPGDGLVPVDSALGRHRRPELTLAFPEQHQWVALGTTHLDLLSSAEVYAQLRTWFS
jgi:pimeloyl-ACP methyl ester carboxylesterase